MELIKFTILPFVLSNCYNGTVVMGLCAFEEKFPCEDNEGAVCFKSAGCKRHNQKPRCPLNMVYANCNTCQRTCLDPKACINSNCTEPKTCVCRDGFLLKGDACVPKEECGCFIEEGGVLSEGQFHVNIDCTRRGDCSNGHLIWNDSYMCNSDEVCDERNDVRQCYPHADCLDVYSSGSNESGIYTILPTHWPGSPFQVYCSMTDGGGWITFQRRVDGTVNFHRNWTSYKEGFGSLDHEHWLGNEKLYYLTNQKNNTIKIDLVKSSSPYYAKYDLFRINGENDNYRFSELGSYSGTADKRGSSHVLAGNGLRRHLNMTFSTYDRDNDIWFQNCAAHNRGGWWYAKCAYCKLNSHYNDSCGISWWELVGGNCNITFTEMKIRPEYDRL